MISELIVGNFKAFSETQHVPIRPITLIFGPNSAGKSSVIHSLALMHESVRLENFEITQTKIGGQSIDLGGFHQYSHRHDVGRGVTLGLKVNVPHRRNSLNLSATRTGRALFSSQQRFIRDIKTLGIEASVGYGGTLSQVKSTAFPFVREFQLEVDSRQIFQAKSDLTVDNLVVINQLNTNHPSVQGAVEYGAARFGTQFRERRTWSKDDLLKSLELFDPRTLRSAIETEGIFPFRVTRGSIEQEEAWISMGVAAAQDPNAALKWILAPSLTDMLRSFNSVLKGAILQLAYLGPLRSYPPRHIAFLERDDVNWFSGGEFAWDVVLQEELVRSQVNAWLSSGDMLSTPYELSVRRMISPSKEAIQEIVASMGAMTPANDCSDEQRRASVLLWATELVDHLFHASRGQGIDELFLMDMRTKTPVSHRDVGIGISQVLPVLVNAFGGRDQLIAIEQPEIHLHPALQAELGDVFIESALGDNQNTFILETHSEHLVLRVLRRIRESSRGQLLNGKTRIQPDDVAVLYIRPTPHGSEVVEMVITEEGEFLGDWPNGFFPERSKELS